MAYKVCKFGRCYGSKIKGILLEEQSTSATSPLQKWGGGVPEQSATIYDNICLALIGEY